MLQNTGYSEKNNTQKSKKIQKKPLQLIFVLFIYCCIHCSILHNKKEWNFTGTVESVIVSQKLENTTRVRTVNSE